jgi:hypothetical protein
MHHESRKDLVPQGNKLRKMDAIATIEQDKQLSQRALNKKVRSSAFLPTLRLVNEKGQVDPVTYHPQASQSMYDLRFSSAPSPKEQFRAPVSPPLPILARKFSFDASPSPVSHTRAASTGDYFSYRPYQPTPSSCGNSSRVRSPFSNRASIHQHNPDTTFDAFLVPHKSGKGEAYRGGANAKKQKGSESSISDHSLSPAKEKSSLRRFSRMPSLPSLKKHKSRHNLDKEEEEDVPPLP